MQPGSLQVGRSLSAKLIRSTLLLACVLGLVISLIQIGVDLRRTERHPD